MVADEMGKDAGVIPGKVRNQPMQASSTPGAEESRMQELAVKIVEGAMRRRRSFDLPMPEMEEVVEEAAIKAKGAQKEE